MNPGQSEEGVMDAVNKLIAKSEMLGFMVYNPVASVRDSYEKDKRILTKDSSYYNRFKCMAGPDSLKTNQGCENYVDYGRRVLADYHKTRQSEKAKNTPMLACYDYGALITAILARKFETGVPAPELATLEVFHAGRPKVSDHVFVVVNRADRGQENDATSWGDGTFIVDAWYAAQRGQGTVAEEYSVKDVNAGTAFHDAAYIKFLVDMGGLYQLARFL